MSGIFEPLSLRWKVHLPNKSSAPASPKFHLRNCECYLDCGYVVQEDIDLRLNTATDQDLRFYPPLIVTVQVEEGNFNRVLPELTQTRQDWPAEEDNAYVIWVRKTSDVEAAVPLFRSKRELTFRVTFSYCKTDSVTDDETSDSASLSAGQVISSDKNPDLCLESLAEDFAKLLDTSSNPDVELHCEGHTTRAHKIILCTRSPVLASMLQSDMVEGRTGVANIRDMTNDTLQQFLRYLYTGKLDTLTFDAAMRLYEAGDMYGVKRLASRCSGFLISGLTVENACDALVVADAHSDSEFKEAVIVFMLAKEVPMSGDCWQDFCETHPKLANKVYGRFCEMLHTQVKIHAGISLLD